MALAARGARFLAVYVIINRVIEFKIHKAAKWFVMPTTPVTRSDLEILVAEELPNHWIIRNRKSGKMWMKSGAERVPYQGDLILALQDETITEIVVRGMSKAEVEGYV